MENDNGKRIRGEDLICKLKDDGDFDVLRIKIVRKLKENEELRKNIIATVKESAALNRPGAENMRPRQLSDAIFQEVGDKVMGKISDELWNTIRTGDGIQTEITQTIQSVYNKLLNPQLNEAGESASHSDLQPARNGVESNGHIAVSGSGIDATVSADAEPKKPPGFARLSSNQNSKSEQNESSKEESGLPVPTDGKTRETYTKSDTDSSLDLVPDKMDAGAPPGFAIGTKEKNPDDVNDEDPEVPPGFG
ncbi:uncharacterized protein LOC107851456 [Capsicum annuum]|uniref:uncharacterized protein LOC107851456 n=1 Tax=Capsicum annuum TaxID=4072 RepID=UPI001FB195ED|nr:uncharacterized protein LOC107851456 [Capsicum annuum]XP_047258315.1 uncharacterized protein LOC107851456 [Capsicum annuum]XP_047258319.1 uncharacterized protein LOC107851456 [Capsicum annuum]XP_047258323.1 uncharacterized protein LOC107851456 [Capsicum annuum]XP_047258327.1 uncharacterized protein LOC107851456 [Capsicum annuum]XP_047258333.1 uncharacterized protein LOC107851456 [Capsicum annuum]XP_047258336.1 uncharacterized protein LOC107851456 [Capsicum annuum]XP_047258338.1 uncharacte